MPRKAKSKNYFTKDTENAIVKYNNEPNSSVRSLIYEREIHYAFFKLTENIIHTFKFYYTDVDDIEHLQHEVITFLLSKIHLFDPTRGAKAYSYFGTIAKRYLILQNQKNYKKRVDKAPVDVLFKDDSHSYSLDDPDPANLPINQFLALYVEYCTENLYELFPKKREDIDIFNKKALYIYIREMVDVKTPKITKIVNQLYGIFKDNYIFFLDHGYVEFE